MTLVLFTTVERLGRMPVNHNDTDSPIKLLRSLAKLGLRLDALYLRSMLRRCGR